jgi:hypothetical protein
LGFELMPRIRNWKELTFYRPGRQATYVHIDALFGEPGKNVIDWDLVESQFRHLMRVAISVREGVLSSTLLFKRLRSGSRRNATYTAFREVGRVVRTAQLLRYLADPAMRRRVTAATNKVEAYNGFSQWLHFGNRGVIADNDPAEQEKAMKFNSLLTNAVIFHQAVDIAQVVRVLQAEGWKVEPEDLAEVSPYIKEATPGQPVILTVHEMKRLARNAAELMALAAQLQAGGIQLELLSGPLVGIYDPRGMGSMLFAVLAVAAQRDRDYIREKTLEGQQAAASRGNHGGRPKVVDADMLVFARALRDQGVSVPDIAKKLTIKSGKNAGQHPSVASVYRALADADRAQAAA